MNSFPVHDEALALLKDALNTSLIVDEEGNHVPFGGDFTLSDLLNFYSGYDPSKLEHLHGNVYEYTGGPVYNIRDVVEALLEEVLRLRACAAEEGLLD